MPKPSRESSGRPPRRVLIESSQASDGLSMEGYLSDGNREVNPEHAAKRLANELVICFTRTVPSLKGMKGKKNFAEVVEAWLKWRKEKLSVQFSDPYDPSLNQPSSVFLRQLEQAYKQMQKK